MDNNDKQKEAAAGACCTERAGTDGELGLIRDQINSVDEQLVALLARRRSLAEQAVRVKEAAGSPLRDLRREEEILVQRIQEGRDAGLDAYYLTRIFHEIMDDSVRVQHEYLQRRANQAEGQAEVLRVAFQGVAGAYSHVAAEKFFARRGKRLTFIGCDSYREAMAEVEKGQAEYAVLPIENTASGGINEVYDLLMHTQLAIVGEEKFQIRQCLLGLEQAALEQVRKIICHPETVWQCREFISTLENCSLEYAADAALAAQRVAQDQDPTQAAVAGPGAARHFGLKLLREDIADQKENYTRFLVAARKGVQVDSQVPCKTSLVMSTAQEPGALVAALLVFQDQGINLTKLESRPVLENPWEELFYIDFEGNLSDPRVAAALDGVTRQCRFIKVLGSYPSEDIIPAAVSPEALLRKPGAAEQKPKGPVAKRPASVKDGSGKGYRLVSREYKEDDTVIEVKGVKIGGANFAVIGGPCAVESLDQIFSCAREAKERGVGILRGGCFKPRTSPYSFQGMGFEGLDLLVEAGRNFGLPVVTEVLSADDLERVAEKADIIQIGARNMQNFSLLREVGKIQRPVMLKRGMSSSIDELLNAAEYILSQGNLQVFLCERGIRTFETATRNTLDISAVPVLRSRTHLPVIVDPSHAAGRRDLVPPLAIAAKAVGAHGVMIEFHPDPDNATSDGPQSLTFAQLEDLMRELLG